jgi:hypothetical protein
MVDREGEIEGWEDAMRFCNALVALVVFVVRDVDVASIK